MVRSQKRWGRIGCNKKCPLCWGRKCWDIPKFMELEKMGYPKICAVRLGAQCNKKCDRGWEGKAEIGISQNVSPP